MILNFNSQQLEIILNDDSYRYRAIMGEHNLTLKFELAEFIEFPIGTWCSFEGEEYTLEEPFSFVKKHERQFDYTLVMGSSQYKLKKYKLKNIVDKRLKFPYTAKPIEHIHLIVDNLNLRDSGWTVGECIDSTEKLISYNHTFCLDALNQVAGEFETEWEITLKEISLRKVEKNIDFPLALSYGRGNGFRTGLGRTYNSGKKAVEILYVQGGERNIDFSKYGSRELLLPKSEQLVYEGRTYESDAEGYSIQGNDRPLLTHEEDSVDLSHIYPSRVGTVSEVVDVDIPNHFYDIIDLSIPSTLNFEECLIAGNSMTIIFQSGMLSGREFEVKYKHADKKFEIVPQELDGFTMPDEIFKPVAGDEYAVFNMMMPESYICDNVSKTGASWDMFREAAKYMYENENPGFSFTGELDGIWAKKDWLNIGGKIVLGGYVEFTDNQFQTTPILIRIVGINDKINNPHSPTIELSNTTASVSISSELKRLDAKEVLTDQQHKDSLQFTRRTFRSAQETMKMLEGSLLNFSGSINPVAIYTMGLLVGDDSLQFRFVDNKIEPQKVAHLVNFNTGTKVFTSEAGIMQHMTFGISKIKPTRDISEYTFWDVEEFTSPPLMDVSVAYYVYVEASKIDSSASFYMSETAIEMEPVGDYYYFLMGILNSELDEDREFSSMYNFTQIAPGKITTDVVATDTLLANEARLADWIIKNGKIASQGASNNIPWAELDGVNGLIKFIKDAMQAQFGNIEGIPTMLIKNAENYFKVMSSATYDEVKLLLSSIVGNNIELCVRNNGCYIKFTSSDGDDLSLTPGGIYTKKANIPWGVGKSNIASIFVSPIESKNTGIMAAIYANSGSFTGTATKYAAYHDGNVMATGYSKLGSDAPVIKIKKLTGTTASNEGGSRLLSHGLDRSKIILASAVVDNHVLPGASSFGYRYDVILELNYINILNDQTSSEYILNKNVIVTIIYEL